MPRIPGIQYTNTAPGPVAGGQATAVGEGAAMARGLQQLGDSLSEITGAVKDVWDDSRATKVMSDATTRLQKFTQDLTLGSIDDQGNFVPPASPDQHEELYRKEVESINSQAENELGSGRTLRKFSSEFTPLAQRQGYQVSSNAIELYKGQIQSLTDDALDKWATSYVNAPELQKPEIQLKAMQTINERQTSGVYTPAEALARQRRFFDQAETGSFRKMLKADPAATMLSIRQGDYKNLPIDTQEKFYNMAVSELHAQTTQRNVDEERRERKLRQQQQDLQNDTGKEAAKLLSENKLSGKWLLDNRDNLSKEDFSHFMLEASGRGAEYNDRDVYTNLALGVSDGQDVRENAAAAYKSGAITKGSFDRLISESEGRSASGGQTNTFVDGRDKIKLAMGPVSEMRDPAERVRAVRILDAWADWNNDPEHKKATATEAREEIDRLIGNLKIANMKDWRSGFIKPRFYKPQSDVIATKKVFLDVQRKTKEAFDAGKITKGDYQRETIEIQRWYKNSPEDAPPKTEVK